MGKIVILDELTANQIAAGEVVERPASVVKELVENSIDAGASSITVEIKNGGIMMIKVVDNGCGLEYDDVELAFERHATSKIRGPKDLESIYTFGFRGEALASIASVSNVELLTRTSNMENGVLIKLSGGKVIDISPWASPKGTSISVNNLFFNTPARFKFLKKDTTEGGHVSDVVSRAALGNPDISFKFINNRATTLHSPGNGDLKSAIFSVYGKEVAGQLMELSYEGDGIKVTGFAGKASIARGSRTYQTFFINKRFIKSRVITAAIDEAYKTVVMKNKYPFIVLNLEINPHLVDVNVHPQKLEVRFSDEQLIFRSVYAAINNAILGRNFSFTRDNDAKKKEDIFALNLPEAGEENYVQQQIEQVEEGRQTRLYGEKPGTQKVTWTKQESDKQGSSIGESFKSHQSLETAIQRPAGIPRLEEVGGLPVRESDKRDVEVVDNYVPDKVEPDCKTSIEEVCDNVVIHEEVMQTSGISDSPISKNIVYDNKSTINDNKCMPMEEKATLYHQEVKTGKNEIFSLGYSIIGQLFKTYIIIEQEKEVFFIDQHAAHERIMFEELKQKFYRDEPMAQMLLVPITLELTTKEVIFLRENLKVFEKMGFVIEEFGHNSFLLRSVTFGISDSLAPKELFLSVFDYMMNNLSCEKFNMVMDETLYMLACKSAVKANKTLKEPEINALIDRLETLENPHTCPHGRPTVLKFSKYEIEKLFKRIV